MNVALRTAGVLLLLLGLFVALTTYFLPGRFVEGLSYELGALLLVGGILAVGISVAVSAVDNLRIFLAGEDPSTLAPPAPAKTMQPSATSVPTARGQASPPDLSRRSEKMQTSLRPLNEGPPRFGEERALTPHSRARSALDRVADEVREAAAEMETGQDIISEEELYVVDERTIAGKQARILSDGTVEAETDEGWMRFENIEHLEEYMDAVRRQRGI